MILISFLCRPVQGNKTSIITEGGRMELYSNGKIRNMVRLLAVIGSSVLPILSIVVLYVIPSANARLGCIVAFSSLCSAMLATLSNAKNVEIIAATAAYVLVYSSRATRSQHRLIYVANIEQVRSGSGCLCQWQHLRGCRRAKGEIVSKIAGFRIFGPM